MDEAVPSVQAALVDEADALLEVPLAEGKTKPVRIQPPGVAQDLRVQQGSPAHKHKLPRAFPGSC